MKIKIDNKEIMDLSNTMKKVIKHDIHFDEFEADMERRVCYILQHKYERCLERLRKEWEPKLRERVSSLPSNLEELAELIFSQPDYKDRKKREEEIKDK